MGEGLLFSSAQSDSSPVLPAPDLEIHLMTQQPDLQAHVEDGKSCDRCTDEEILRTAQHSTGAPRAACVVEGS
eukprot:CAMPEP_0194761052 /NCGR_PEP_ID=MMETSP0323_2-20130528/13838_1 /TAXON_ID=2866 ORGANISM="Crypthecodinium cohnii, Strain Seligo" /NCGR_SAMPLE_ID=MMETSP0323_2 /ASSEMBLY_ACC=CAM_ASM_000346 /LENGTH=72 /DNA_ID=CAMNT_0039682613 /DNA_START=101 /DNA_END=319 /DNA_ORIENTATION=+